MTVATRSGDNIGTKQIRALFAAEEKLAKTVSYYDEDTMIELLGVSFLADDDHIFGAPNDDYIKREIEWYLSESPYVSDIPGNTPKIWRDIADGNGMINSNYGYLLFGEENYNQYQRVVNTLMLDRESRQGIAIYTRPTMHLDAYRNGMQDFVCTNTVQYIIRNSRLHVVVNMRSNDAVFGYRNDYAWQRFVQDRMIEHFKTRGDLSLAKGRVIWQVGSMHVYPRHRHLIDRFIETGEHNISVTKG